MSDRVLHYIIGILSAVTGALVIFGVIDAEQATGIGAVLAAALGFYHYPNDTAKTALETQAAFDPNHVTPTQP
jgi:hypothetical protein